MPSLETFNVRLDEALSLDLFENAPAHGKGIGLDDL